MSLETAGVWQTGVWATTVWADGVWREGEFVSATLQGNKMFATYEDRTMAAATVDTTMEVEYKLRKMIR